MGSMNQYKGICKKRQAQAMVEFALTLPVFLLAVWGY
jgi:Flp pilus assembly protein TadG